MEEILFRTWATNHVRVKATIVGGFHNGRNWVALLNCTHNQKHDRLPELGDVVTCRRCTSAHAITREAKEESRRRLKALYTPTEGQETA